MNQTQLMGYFAGYMQKQAGVSKEAGRGDMALKLLSNLSRRTLFKNKLIEPPSKAITGGWQTSYNVIGAPNGVHSYFNPNTVKEVSVGGVRGGDLLKRLRDALYQIPARGGGWFGNEQKDAADLVKQIRAAVKAPDIYSK